MLTANSGQQQEPKLKIIYGRLLEIRSRLEDVQFSINGKINTMLGVPPDVRGEDQSKDKPIEGALNDILSVIEGIEIQIKPLHDANRRLDEIV